MQYIVSFTGGKVIRRDGSIENIEDSSKERNYQIMLRAIKARLAGAPLPAAVKVTYWKDNVKYGTVLRATTPDEIAETLHQRGAIARNVRRIEVQGRVF